MAATVDPRAKPPPAPSHHLKPWAPTPPPPRAHRVPSLPGPAVAGVGAAREWRRSSSSSRRRVGAGTVQEELRRDGPIKHLRANLMGQLRDAAGHHCNTRNPSRRLLSRFLLTALSLAAIILSQSLPAMAANLATPPSAAEPPLRCSPTWPPQDIDHICPLDFDPLAAEFTAPDAQQPRHQSVWSEIQDFVHRSVMASLGDLLGKLWELVGFPLLFVCWRLMVPRRRRRPPTPTAASTARRPSGGRRWKARVRAELRNLGLVLLSIFWNGWWVGMLFYSLTTTDPQAPFLDRLRILIPVDSLVMFGVCLVATAEGLLKNSYGWLRRQAPRRYGRH